MAQTVTVDTVEELKTELGQTSRTEALIINLSDNFPDQAVLTQNIPWDMGHGQNVELDGNNKELIINGGFRHFSVSNSSGGGIITIQNIILSGQDMGGGIDFSSTSSFIKNVSLKENLNGTGGGALLTYGDLTIENCTFYKNRVTGAGGYGGGAIRFINYSAIATISKSTFIENEALIRGGAISLYAINGGTLNIESCYFYGNKTTVNDNYHDPYADGGAIDVFNNNSQYLLLSINNSTFESNIASDDGGAVFLQNEHISASNLITNCTMYNNIANDIDNYTGKSTAGGTVYESGGGAVQLSIKTVATLESNTIVNNSTPYAGAGIGVHSNSNTGSPTLLLKNNIILNNILTGTPLRENRDNIDVYKWDGTNASDAITVSTGNIGVDNGVELDPNIYSLENVFGTDSPELIDGGSNTIGRIGNQNETAYDPMDNNSVRFNTLMPTLIIIPNDGSSANGLADGQGIASIPALDLDQQGFYRDATNPDVGAVEIVWVRFDANGGYWEETEDYKSTSPYYYTKDSENKVEYYFGIIRNDGVNKAVKPTDPTPPVGSSGEVIWKLDDLTEATWNFDNPVTENIKLKATWEVSLPTHKVTYMVNGSDIQNFPDPAEYNVADGSTYSVVSPDPTRTNYTFQGWEATSSVEIENGTPSGSNEFYKADDTFTMPAADVVLTAQWIKNTPPPEPEPEPETPVLLWSISTTTSDPSAFSDIENDITTKVEEGTPVYLQIRPVVDPEIKFDSWAIDYTAVPTEYHTDMSPISGTSRYNFNDGEAHELVGEYIYTVNRLQLYDKGVLVESFSYYRPVIRQTIVITQKTNPKPDPDPDPEPEPDPDPWPPVIPDPDPDPDPNPDAWIILKPVAPLCYTENEFRIAFDYRYTDKPLQYAIAFTDAAKEAGFEDVSTYSDMPQEKYITIKVNRSIPKGTYYGYVIARIKGTSEIDLIPFTIHVLDYIQIVKHPVDIINKCDGDGLMLSVEATGENLRYQWYLNDKLIPGATSNTYETILTTESEGHYYVEIMSDCGMDISDTAQASLNPFKVLMKWDDVLYIQNTDNRYVSFQWYKDGEAIAVHGKSIYYTNPDGLTGSYFVRAYKADDTYDQSCTIEIYNTTSSSSLKVYPNLVNRNEYLTIESNGIEDSYIGARIDIYDMNGRKVLTTRIVDYQTTIPMNLSFGTYLVQITASNGKIKTEKIIVK